MIGILKFMRDYGDHLVFIVLFIVILFFFLREFKITSKNSWMVLLGFSALGGLFAFKAWQRKKLLEELKRREEALKQIEDRYEQLKNEHQLSQAAYEKAKAELDRAKVDAALAILRAQEEHAARAVEIENEYQNISADELIAKIKGILQN
ncbi:MAG TPA: hypothetical protein VGA99_04935 [bacterium]